MKRLLLIIVFGSLFSVNSYADLYSSKSFNCSYYFTSVGEIKNKKYKVDIEKLQRFEFSIVNIDPNTKRSLMVGNNGTDKMTVINTNQSGIHFFK